MNYVRCAEFDFRIARPKGWEVLPAPWVHAYLGRAAPTSEALANLLHEAQTHEPFLLMHKPAEDPGLAMPTVQCKATPIAAMNAQGSMMELLQSITEKMSVAFTDFRVEFISDEYLAAGSKGGRIVASMTVKNPEGQAFHCTSESLFLPSKKFLFMIGMSATSDLQRRPEADFQTMINSISLGTLQEYRQ